jgi:hypothetical protein
MSKFSWWSNWGRSRSRGENAGGPLSRAGRPVAGCMSLTAFQWLDIWHVRCLGLPGATRNPDRRKGWAVHSKSFIAVRPHAPLTARR